MNGKQFLNYIEKTFYMNINQLYSEFMSLAIAYQVLEKVARSDL